MAKNLTTAIIVLLAILLIVSANIVERKTLTAVKVSVGLIHVIHVRVRIITVRISTIVSMLTTGLSVGHVRYRLSGYGRIGSGMSTALIPHNLSMACGVLRGRLPSRGAKWTGTGTLLTGLWVVVSIHVMLVGALIVRGVEGRRIGSSGTWGRRSR